MADVQNVEAEVIEAPTVQTQLDKLVSEATSKAETWPQRFHPQVPANRDDYVANKESRKALRKEIAEIEDSRKSLFAPLKTAIRAGELRVNQATKAGKDIDDQYKACNKEYEDGVVAHRLSSVEEYYGELAPDLVPLVPFSRIVEKYGGEKKWSNYGTKEAQIRKDLEEIVSGIAKDEQLIEAQNYDEEDKKRLKALYFSLLDFAEAARQAQAEREQRERVETLEEERKARADVPEKVPDIVPQPAPTQDVVSSPWVIIIDQATRDQIIQVVTYLKGTSLEGHVMQGTIEQAYQAVKDGR